MKRVKKLVLTGTTREAADEAFKEYASAVAEITKVTAEIELECVRVRDARAGVLESLSRRRDEAFELLHAYATEHQEELFAKRKSLEMAQGTIGFRTGTPKLKTLKGFTWASALQLVKEFLPNYVRKEEEIAKDKLLADREVTVTTGVGASESEEVPMLTLMAKCGITVAQDETFFVEPKSEETA
jgi:phage host-nuclease inhibitor protein Gam